MSPESADASRDLTIAVVVHNEESRILALLKSLENQKISGLKVLMVDNLSTDKTVEKTLAFKIDSTLSIEVLQNQTNHMGTARQLALESCTTPILAFVDGDCVVPEGWVSSMAAYLAEVQGLGVCSANELPSESSLHQAINIFQRSWWGSGGSPQAYQSTQVQSVDHLPTTCCLLNVRVAKRVGGFSTREAMDGNDFSRCGEDLEFGYRAKSFGESMHIVPAPTVVNGSVENWVDWYSRMKRFGAAQIRVFVRYPDFFYLRRLAPTFLLPALPILMPLFLLLSIGLCGLERRPLLSLKVLYAFLLTYFAYGWGQWVEWLKVLLVYRHLELRKR